MVGHRILALGFALGALLVVACGDDGGSEPMTDGGVDAGPDPCDGVDCSSLDDACGVGVCQGDGECVRMAVPDGTVCDDEDVCTGADTCTAGICGGVEVDCSGLDDMCNIGVCDDTDGSCLAQPVSDGTLCDDGDACTTDDACTAGTCGGAEVDCSGLDDMCNVGTCDDTDGSCVAEPVVDGTGCDDGDACTTTDTCTLGTCSGIEVDCSGLDDSCNTGVCNATDGSCEAEPFADGTTCDDGDVCTDADACTVGVCSGAAIDCSESGDACNDGVCDSLSGECVASPVTDGTSCDDGDLCTVDDACETGTCVSGDELDCSRIATECTVGMCDGTTGECVSTDVADGTSCDDGFSCTTSDQCSAGGCLGESTACDGELYVEGFESGAGGWTTGGTGSTWELGEPTNVYIDAAYEGTQAWVTNLDGDYSSSESSYIESPSFDFSGLENDPSIRFKQIFDIEESSGSDDYDEHYVEVSTDGGSTWTKVGTTTSTSGINWYTDTMFDWWDGASGEPGKWRTASHLLTDTAGFSDVRIRFVFSSDSSVQQEGVGIDQVQIFADASNDLGVGAVTAPVPGCPSTTTGSLVVEVTNFGGTSVSSFDLSYTPAGGSTVTETVSRSIAAYGTVSYAFTSEISASSATLVAVEVDAAGDPYAGNDSGGTTVLPGLGIVTLGTGYSEGFESGDGNWVSSGTNSSWARGEPTGAFIDAAGAGTYAWVTNPTGEYNNDELSYLTTGFCFDFTDETDDPDLSFLHVYETEEDYDEGWVEISTDGGATWTKLGTSSTGTNWYNVSGDDWWDGTSDAAGDWRTASHPLSRTAGEASVRIRFVFRSDISNTFDGFGVDSIAIDPATP